MIIPIRIALTTSLFIIIQSAIITTGTVNGQSMSTTKINIGKLTRVVNQLEELSIKMYNEFELTKKAKRSYAKIVNDAKQHKHKLRQVTWQINQALASDSIFSFIQRLVLQLNSIQCDKICELFDWIVMKISCHVLDIADIEGPWHFSEEIEIANNVAQFKLSHLVFQANQTNKLIAGVLTRVLNGTKVTKDMKSHVNNQLEIIIESAAKIRTELSTEYRNEVPKHMDIDMNMVQKLQMEKLNDELQFLEQFVRAYQRMLVRLLK